MVFFGFGGVAGEEEKGLVGDGRGKRDGKWWLSVRREIKMRKGGFLLIWVDGSCFFFPLFFFGLCLWWLSVVDLLEDLCYRREINMTKSMS